MVKTYTLKTVPHLKAIRWWGDNFEEVKGFLGDRYIEVNELFPREIKLFDSRNLQGML